ncbi:hypothetical protein [Sphaerisporangium fuscum]|uniref:hypothetical protein n=1 Tax=Sphaerisporangium fuscum TaxID=2835868 RepID=UPI001BDC56F9|nr:hypothetical protein [Sphaerisporangium fuscum]
MKPETLVAETLREWSEEVRIPHDLADRALRGRVRRRLRRTAVAAVLVAAVAGIGLAVPPVALTRAMHSPAAAPDPSSTSQVGVAPSEAPFFPTLTDTHNSPPRTLVAAGEKAVSAYHIDSQEKLPDGRVRDRSTWYLYNPVTDRYDKTDWAKLDVSSGLEYAAVLEYPLPAHRVGILDMRTREIVKWIDLEHPVGAVSWSPTKGLLTTTYDRDPGIHGDRTKSPVRPMPPSRTGFQMVNIDTGQSEFHAVTPSPQVVRAPDADLGPFGWTPYGELIWEDTNTNPSKVFYDMQGRRHDPPDGWTHALQDTEDAGIAVYGKKYAAKGDRPGAETAVKDIKTGKTVGVQKMRRLLAWADDETLIALGCAASCEDGSRGQLVMVGIDGKNPVQMSADLKIPGSSDTWQPLLTRR